MLRNLKPAALSTYVNSSCAIRRVSSVPGSAVTEGFGIESTVAWP
jgi:hypothetical protein